MRDTELYRHLLGLVAPWGVDRFELSVERGRVDVWVPHPGRTRFACPECEVELSVYDHAEERAWRHPDRCAFLTFLHPSPPRVKCAEHGGASDPAAVAELAVHDVVRVVIDRRARRL
jgi:hypothetical protein